MIFHSNRRRTIMFSSQSRIDCAPRIKNENSSLLDWSRIGRLADRFEALRQSRQRTILLPRGVFGPRLKTKASLGTSVPFRLSDSVPGHVFFPSKSMNFGRIIDCASETRRGVKYSKAERFIVSVVPRSFMVTDIVARLFFSSDTRRNIALVSLMPICTRHQIALALHPCAYQQSIIENYEFSYPGFLTGEYI